MKFGFGSLWPLSISLACLLFPVVTSGAEFPGVPVIEFIGEAQISGTATDLSGHAESLENGEPQNRFGGISALEYTGVGNRYIALPDRGPDDGATDYRCRYQVVEIVVRPGTTVPVKVELKETHMLCDGKGRPFVGASTAIECTEKCAGRFDPEGIRVLANGRKYLADEYGPLVIELDADDHETRRFTMPSHLCVSRPSASPQEENEGNSSGRVFNRGMEGLAISQDRQKLYGIMQSSLLQDGVRTPSGKIMGRYSRLIEIDVASGAIREFAYPMEDPSYGISEILECGPGQFLVLERDGKQGEEAKYRHLNWIDLSGATDIAQIDALPADALPAEIKPVRKRTYLDFNSPEFKLAGPNMPEKIEGITYGPKLPDGRQTIVCAIDNDFEGNAPSKFWVFAINTAQFAAR
ncbi:esterase-like activity of phytase family protein [Blastopirellula sp. JC732]|uniref:Esterase-like activity of phytase family protein n=1 Tax=Blastopirellula sediminis TaxID=2894196 RepID=A0A9X1MLB8_9BACT|nr:esterase-like activity of phytase family protein [Blastopirellula sediminis]MCC9608903.1 esterase-like activity of phytase family protein [Blastopirellula sediminis]MCC9628320.1 esterase-like activity of phytase family protein [Blastopirellula sediminis]